MRLPITRRSFDNSRPIRHRPHQGRAPLHPPEAANPPRRAIRSSDRAPAPPRPPAGAPRRCAHARTARRRPDCPSTARCTFWKSKSSGASALRNSIMKRTESAPTSSTTSRSVIRSPERFDMRTGSPLRKSFTSWQKLDFQGRLAVAHRRHGRLHPLLVAAMVDAQHVDHGAEAAQILVVVIGDVGGEVGVAAVRLDQRPVDVVAELGGAEQASAPGPPSPPAPGPSAAAACPGR